MNITTSSQRTRYGRVLYIGLQFKKSKKLYSLSVSRKNGELQLGRRAVVWSWKKDGRQRIVVFKEGDTLVIKK